MLAITFSRIYSSRMARASNLLYILPTAVFMVAAVATAPTGARADWCQNTNGTGLVECNGTPPSSWTNCGTFNGSPVWCFPTAGSGTTSKHRNNNATKNTLIAVGVGIAVVGLMWWIFRTPPSENNPGQVKLAAF